MTQPLVKCLIVDDREENLLALSKVLEHDDVELLEAHSGAEALDLLLAHDVALALLDVQMPDMDGFELAELMRGSARTRHVPIIFITAGAHDQHRMFKGYETGAVDFLHKPIEPRILKNKVDVFFELYRQRQQLARELRERTETLRLNEMFTAVLGHDLRNPMNAILTAAQLLEHKSTDEAVRKTAGRMMSSAKRMSRLIEDMLDLARARLAGGIPLRRERSDLGNLVHRVVEEQQAVSSQHRIEVLVEGNLEGDWDADRLTQVTSNLIGNAIQHGDADAPIAVRVEGTRSDHVSLSVISAGRIDDDVLPHIFDPFRGGDRAPGRNEGLGLGLYIVQQIVHAHQGSVHVQSEDETTAFIVRVPRTAAEVVKL
jgi:two-component system, sensor histidine kinase and response regulator